MNNRVELVDMEFYAYHGCFKEENIIGNKFIVNFSASCDIIKAGESDLLCDALDYQKVYTMIKEQMDITSNLLENVAYRILNSIGDNFSQVIHAQITIDKMNPPIGGKVRSSRVKMEKYYR